MSAYTLLMIRSRREKEVSGMNPVTPVPNRREYMTASRAVSEEQGRKVLVRVGGEEQV